jgi:hypothetical protein
LTGRQRQFSLLAVLAIVLVVVWSGVLGGGGDPTETGGRPSNPATRGSNAGADVEVPVEDVALERLTAARDELQPTERNPFRFRPPPPPPPPVATPPPQVTRPLGPTGPPPTVPAPPIPLKYIGYADEAGPRVRFGVFSDGRGTVINASEGDILEGRYRVLRLGTDSADLVYLDGRGRQTIRLSGQ